MRALTSSTRPPATMAATPAHTGMLTRFSSLTLSSSGPSLAAVLSVVYEKPPYTRAAIPATMTIKAAKAMSLAKHVQLVSSKNWVKAKIATSVFAEPMHRSAVFQTRVAVVVVQVAHAKTS